MERGYMITGKIQANHKKNFIKARLIIDWNWMLNKAIK
jgi:hypothetical protein